MNTAENLAKALENLYRAQRSLVELALAKGRAYVDLPPEVKDAIDGIEMEFNPQIEQAEKLIASLEETIKAQGVELGHTVESEHLTLVFMPGKVTWDNRKMEGFIAAHPELEKLKKVGKPYAMIKRKGDQDVTGDHPA